MPAVFLLINQYSTFSWSILSLSWGELSRAYLLPVSPCVFAECGFGCIAGAFVWWFVGWALLGGVSFAGGGACAGVCLGPGRVSVVGLPCGGGY